MCGRKMMKVPAKIVNLTGHKICIFFARNRDDLVIEPSGYVARVDFHKVHDDVLETKEGDKITVVRRQFGQLFVPPDINKLGSHFIVSSLVLEAMREEREGKPLSLRPFIHRFYCPDTGPTALRDKHGGVLAVTRLITL